MTLNTFGLAIAQQLVESDNKFPVDFDLAWEWLGFSNKANAKKALLKAGFIEGVDLILKDERPVSMLSGYVNPNPEQKKKIN